MNVCRVPSSTTERANLDRVDIHFFTKPRPLRGVFRLIGPNEILADSTVVKKIHTGSEVFEKRIELLAARFLMVIDEEVLYSRVALR